MKTTLHKLAVCASSIVCLMFIPGCWDYQKINDRAPVIGIGVDPVPNQPKMMSYTFQIQVFDKSTSEGNSDQGEGSSGGASSSAEHQNFTVRARGVQDGLRYAQLQYPKTFYLSNIQSVVMSEKLTGGQIQSVITELERSPTVDKLAFVCFTPESAKDVMDTPGRVAPADAIDRVLGSSLKQHAFTTRTRVWQFWRDWKEFGVEPQAPIVITEDSHVQMRGMLALRDLTPTEQLSPAETLYFNLVASSVNQIAVWIDDRGSSFEVGHIQSNRRISASMLHGVPVLHAIVRVNGVIVQDETRNEKILTNPEIERYRKVMEEEMQRKATEAVQRLQQQRDDAYGFGRYILVHDPSTRRVVSTRWPEMFARARVDIKVKVTRLQKGTLM
ncbi:Ger(x)C family spore germination protein [Alicyclobacillus sp. ALC3]|uniref:Ger(x)C family spore germination protein n=1 Tax=Alicyclobacillus sp. ALC3 TaxID=2796143 RepID=UPI002377DAC1|nr:Ger(x)C family spore germination C-terminal domain-containing protein [Alicyclobacillus sp. ALC3]WDL96059.1 hypothetical protein JC200_17190 [Alicyclobacillus sp. ALC3]